ncbi:MAG: lipopolysaccharide biosynthesis protein [Mahellales bacterium]|jgi:O-antigen/teichoic acid export membrane protein
MHLNKAIVAKKIPHNLQELKLLINNPLYKNSFFLLLSRGFNAGCGFFFWMVAARLYSMEDVGMATALNSALGLVILFSRLGFDNSLIRFIPMNNKQRVFNTCLIITTIASVFTAVIYISGVQIFSPKLSFLQPLVSVIFIATVVVNSIALTTGNTFIATRKANQYFIQNIFMTARLPLLIPLVFGCSLGIFGAFGISYFLASLYSITLIKKEIGIELKLDRNFIKDSFKFSSGNYIAEALSAAPTYIIPLMIINMLNEAEAAKYYIAFAIGNIVLMVSDALSTSLFVEGSHGENLRNNLAKALLAIFAILLPTATAIYIWSDLLLGLFGKNYIGAFELLRLQVLSCPFVAIYTLFINVQKVRMHIKNIIKVNLIRFAILLSLSYLLIIKFGIIGVGYAWMATYVALCIAIVVMFFIDQNK